MAECRRLRPNPRPAMNAPVIAARPPPTSAIQAKLRVTTRTSAVSPSLIGWSSIQSASRGSTRKAAAIARPR